MLLDRLYRNVLLPPVRWGTRNDAEIAHDWFLRLMRAVDNRPSAQRLLAGKYAHNGRLAQTLMDGLTFPSPFGIAAGLDKNASMIRSLQALMSPGFVEVGTVTPRPQVGNPRPRIVRPDKNNLINAMGFPNTGMDVVLQRLQTIEGLSVPLGLNVGKMKETSEEDSAEEYGALIAATAAIRGRQLPNYYVVNVSSPNTPGLTSFQKIEPLTAILEAVCTQLDALGAQEVNLRHRLLVKLGADLELAELEPIVELVMRLDIGGLITTNTTTTRPVKSRFDDRPGGFSGSGLYDRSAEIVRHTASLLPSSKVLVATGGIDSVDRAFEMLRYANLVGVYTGLVLQGPHLLRALNQGVGKRMEALGVETLSDLREGQRAQ